MAFYGIGNLFGPVPRPDVEKSTKEAEAKEEAEKKKAAAQEKAEAQEEVSPEKSAQAQDQVQDPATQAEAQRQRLMQLQDKVARKLEDFVRAGGRERAESSDAEASGLLQQLASAEGDSFTPENLQRLRQLSQNTQNAVRAGREGRAEGAGDDRTTDPAPQPQVTAGEDFELQARRAAQEIKNQRLAAEEKAPAKAEARTEKPETAKAAAAKAEPPRAESTAAPQAPKAEAGPPRDATAKAETAKPEPAKPEAARPEAATPQLAKPEAAKPEAPRETGGKAEPGKGDAKAEVPEDGREAPPPPRPESMRPRVEAPAAKAPEAAGKPETKPADAKAGPEPEAALPRTPGSASRPGDAARADGLPPRPGDPARPDAAKPTAPRAEAGGTEPSHAGPAPEGPKNAKGQETAGGAAFSAGGTPTERARAKEGDLRFAPHLKDGGKEKPPEGKAKPEPKEEGGWSAMGMGSVRPGSGGPAFLRPLPGGLPFGARPGGGRPGEAAEDDTPAALPRTPLAGAPGSPVAGKPGNVQAGPAKPQAPDTKDSPTKDVGKAPPEEPSDGPRPSSWTGVGGIGSGFRQPLQQPVRPGAGPNPPGPGAQDPGHAGREPVRREMQGGEPPRPSAPLPPQLGHVGGIRIPPPDGGKDPDRKQADDDFHAEDIGIRPGSGGGTMPKPVAGPGSPPGVTPVRGPRQERGPVGEVDGWLPDTGQESPHAGPRWDRIDGIGAPRTMPGRPTYGPPQRPVSAEGPTTDSVGPVGGPRFFPRPGGGSAEGSPGNHLSFELLRRSPFRAENEEVFPGEMTPGPSTNTTPAGGAPRPGWTGMPIGGGSAFRPQMPVDPASRPEKAQAEGEAPTPRVEFLRPKAPPRPGILGDPALRQQEGSSFQGLSPLGGGAAATRQYEIAERARMAARILSGESQFLPVGAGPGAGPLEPVLPGEVRAIAAQPTTSRIEPNSPLRATLPRGPMTGGRPVTSNIPIYQPVLDLIYNIRGKGKVAEESTPIKMTLSGSVGLLERETYTKPLAKSQDPTPKPRPADAENRPAPRENAPSSQRRVFDASDANPLLGQMTASFMGAAHEAPRTERHAPPSQKHDKAEGQTDVSTQSVAEIGDPRGRGGRGGSEGGDGGGQDRRGSGGQGQSEGAAAGEAGPAARGGPVSPEARERMQAFKLASTHTAFRITMDKLENQVSMRKYEVAVRNANTSIESILKRVYRDQELADLDENEAVNSLLMMLKLGGEFTYAHSARVLDFAMELADEMGITDSETRKQVELGALLKDVGEMGMLLTTESDEKIEKIADFMSSQDMRRAGLLHDIGKLRIPPEILYKPGRMTDEEYAIMKMHPLYGEQMIYPIASLRHLCPTIRGHHERWDGKGYPDGLKGERIPLPARILAVADVFDALQAERPYKSGMDVGRVREILEEGKGTHFDPDCVDAFLRVLDRRYPQSARRRSQRVARVLESVDAV